jgi:regulatory protein
VTATRSPGERAGHDARGYALALLAGRAYGARELRSRLVRRGYDDAETDRAIDALEQVGLVDDLAFARQFARSRLESGGVAPTRVQLELSRRGVPLAIAESAIADVLADEAIDVRARLDQLARRRAALVAGLSPSTKRRRLFAFLARRGYDVDAINRAVASALGEGEQDRS